MVNNIKKLKEDNHLNLLAGTLRDFFCCKIEMSINSEANCTNQRKVLSNNKIRYCIKYKDLIINIDLTRNKIGDDYSDIDLYELLFFQINSNYLNNSFQSFDFNLIKSTLSKYLSSEKLTENKIQYAIDYFDRLRTTSFEGQYFSTAMILTTSNLNKEQEEIESNYGKGILSGLNKKNQKSLFDVIDRRFWFLISGEQSYYVCNSNLRITRVLAVDDTASGSYANNLMLFKTLRNDDILFRVHNEKEYSIISNRKEFVFLENKWKYRNYDYVYSLLNESIYGSYDSIIESLMYFIFYCSKNSISSIIWFPKDFELVEAKNSVLKSKNRFLIKTSPNQIKIDDKINRNILIRFLSSDGVTVFDSKGFLKYYGCIVDLETSSIDEIIGTGEVATQILASNGVAIKVSQDGTIKLFIDKNKIEI